MQVLNQQKNEQTNMYMKQWEHEWINSLCDIIIMCNDDDYDDDDDDDDNNNNNNTD